MKGLVFVAAALALIEAVAGDGRGPQPVSIDVQPAAGPGCARVKPCVLADCTRLDRVANIRRIA